MKGYSLYTLRNYEQYLKNFIDFFGDRDISKITERVMLKYHEKLLAEKKKNNTIAFYLMQVVAILRYATLRGMDVMPYELIPIPKYRNTSWQPATKENFVDVLKVIDNPDPFLRLRDELIVRFFFATGVRVSELCDLTLDQISVTKKEAIIVTKKSLRPRVIMWDDETNEVLKVYLEVRYTLALDNYIFISRRYGKKMGTRAVQLVMRILFKKSGIKERRTCHSWRHGYINYGLQNNVQVPHISRMVGHTNWVSTQPYEHLNSADLRKVYNEVYEKRLSTG